jgi:hypothetical protein
MSTTAYLFTIVKGCNVVLRKTGDNNYHLLDPRRDLYKYTGDFSWGYRGTGVQFLANSILGHHLNIGTGGPRPNSEDVNKVIEFLATIPQNAEKEIHSSQIDSLLL